MTVQASFAAMVVGVMGSEAIDLLFARDHEAAFTTRDHAGVRERSRLSRSPGPSQKLLYVIEFLKGDHGLMLTRICLSFPFKDARIKGIRKGAVDGAQGGWFSAYTFSFDRAKSPVLRGHFPKAAWGIVARSHELPHPLDQGKSLGIGGYRFGFFVIQISNGGNVGEPSLLDFRAVSPADVFAE